MNEKLVNIRYHGVNESENYDLYIKELIQWQSSNLENYGDVIFVKKLIYYLMNLKLMREKKLFLLIKNLIIHEYKLIILKIVFKKICPKFIAKKIFIKY